MVKPIKTDKAPHAIGPYSQAVVVDKTVYISGQIPLNPQTMEMVEGGMSEQTKQVFDNLTHMTQAAGGDLSNIVRVNIMLADMADFATVNELMAQYFSPPYPARSCIGGLALPKGSRVEIEAIMILP